MPFACRPRAGTMPAIRNMMSRIGSKEDAVRKIRLNGKKIKELRDGRDRAATQKEFAHEIRISERRLRAIENKNALVTPDVADRIAHALNKPLQTLLAQDDRPPPPPQAQSVPEAVKPVRCEQLLPRFDALRRR
jgi:transcriptional regulator with XRE-family HTH domain